MNRSYSKIRHIQESNKRLENRLISEVDNIRQMTGLVSEKYKISKDERLILSDTENFLQVLPLTETASCKYGASTKWCVTGNFRGGNRFKDYKSNGWDVSMVMIKNPEIREVFNTGKFAFNIYNNNFLEIHNDRSHYLRNLEEKSKELGIEDEVKGLVDDYINFMKENRGLGDVVNLPFKS